MCLLPVPVLAELARRRFTAAVIEWPRPVGFVDGGKMHGESVGHKGPLISIVGSVLEYGVETKWTVRRAGHRP